MPQKSVQGKVTAAVPVLSLTTILLFTTVLLFTTACTSSKPAIPEPSPLAISARLPSSGAVDYVAAVRESTMSGYPSTSIGKAFDTAFHDVQWHSSVTKEGARVVNFTGQLPANLRQDCLASKGCQDAKVTFQWTFAPDSGLFHLSYVDPEPWPPAYRSTRDMLLFIYG